MDKLREMEVFVAVVDRGSLTGASEKLGMSTAAISRALTSLEMRIGAQLLVRTTRSIRSTDAGVTYLESCRRVLDAIADSELDIAAYRLNPLGTLTISAPVLFGQQFVAPIVNAFALQYPDISVNAIYADRTTRLLDEGVDVAVRIGHLGDSSNFAVPLGFVRRRTYAAPSYLEVHGEPLHPQELSSHNVISFTGVTHALEWVFRHQGVRVPVKVRPRMIVDLASAAISATMDGLGVTQLLSYQAAHEVARRRIRPILSAFEPDPIPVNILHLERRRVSGKVRAFLDFATERLRTNSYLEGGTAANPNSKQSGRRQRSG